MWKCKQCGSKNNNSSINCHMSGCSGVREGVAYEIPSTVIKKQEIKTVVDICPVCNTERLFEFAGRVKLRKTWRCTSCHKKFHQLYPHKPSASWQKTIN